VVASKRSQLDVLSRRNPLLRPALGALEDSRSLLVLRAAFESDLPPPLPGRFLVFPAPFFCIFFCSLSHPFVCGQPVQQAGSCDHPPLSMGNLNLLLLLLLLHAAPCGPLCSSMQQHDTALKVRAV
jgi:hypothetical protein